MQLDSSLGFVSLVYWLTGVSSKRVESYLPTATRAATTIGWAGKPRGLGVLTSGGHKSQIACYSWCDYCCC